MFDYGVGLDNHRDGIWRGELVGRQCVLTVAVSRERGDSVLVPWSLVS